MPAAATTPRLLKTAKQTKPLDAGGADSKHGTYGAVIEEEGRTKLMASGGAVTVWFEPTSKVHIFLPPAHDGRAECWGPCLTAVSVQLPHEQRAAPR